MGKRIDRVNELLRREIGEVLRTRYRSDAVAITISDVDCAPDLRRAKVYYSVIGDDAAQIEAARFFRKYAVDIKQRVGKVVILKYLPDLEFVHDPSLERGAHILELLDELDQEKE